MEGEETAGGRNVESQHGDHLCSQTHQDAYLISDFSCVNLVELPDSLSISFFIFKEKDSLWD